LNKNERDEKVRRMLLPDIPVVYGNDKQITAMYMSDLGVQVYHSHHQASQQRAAEALAAYPVLHERLINIGTSHGMYENLPGNSIHYLLVNSPLMEHTDRWTIVADKNLIPFKDYNVYSDKIFRKIPNGMERPASEPADLTSFGITKDSFTVCIVSRAKKEKGWLNAVNAVEAARERTGKDVHLILVGDGEVYDEYSQTLSNDHIHFIGFSDDPCSYMKSADLVTLPSYYASESAPLCLIEAMMCGKPCLATDIGDVRDMLTCDGELAGDVSPMEDFTVDDADLTDRLVRLITNKTAYKKAARTAKKKSAVYEIDNVAREYLSLYSDWYTMHKRPEPAYIMDLQNKRSRILAESENGRGPLVTVIVPNYCHEKFLPERLDCIFEQTYRNIDVLLMDDCSKDNSREILMSYAERYPDKARILFNDTNSGGVFRQWAKGIQNAKGDLCWIAESDDFCERDFLESVLPAFEDPDVKLSYCRYCFVDENDRRNEEGFDAYMSAVSDTKWRHNYVNDSEDEVETALGIINTIPNASGAVFRRPVDDPIFDDEDWYRMKICGDWLFYLHILKGGKVAYTIDTTSYFRFHSNNSSAKTYTNDTYYKEHAVIASAIRNLYHTDRKVIERNNERIRLFYHDHVEGTDADFEKLYNVDDAMRFVYDRRAADKAAVHQSEKIRPGGKTVIIDPLEGLRSHQDLTILEKMVYAGGNSGNMLYVKAVEDQIDYKDRVWFNSMSLSDKGTSGASAVIPATNLIIRGPDHLIDSMRPIYEHSECNITMVGLGAQAYPPFDTPKK
ncbi:MAG: glycosyltransferase, partial [Oscillospiraceae bacterium]|nr:glycosyltransferase [Oscillospiraceae bacterium]